MNDALIDISLSHDGESIKTYSLTEGNVEDRITCSTKQECIICYDVTWGPIVTCNLCSNYSHYKCYKQFTKKNNFYRMKCVHCGTRSLNFHKRWWHLWCCFY